MNHPTAEVNSDAKLPDSVAVWQYAHIRERVEIGENCIIGRGVYIAPGVKIGDDCKVQNYAMKYEPAVLSEGVFIGPAVVLTNDECPRSITPDGKLKTGQDWPAVGVTVKQGATIVARSVCVAPVTIGARTLVAAGSVVTCDIPVYALVSGVPARRIGWVGKAGVPLVKLEENKCRCPQAGAIHLQTGPDALVEKTV